MANVLKFGKEKINACQKAIWQNAKKLASHRSCRRWKADAAGFIK
jgi:hypothetical protein